MMIVDNKQIGFIYKNSKSIDKIFKEGEVVFERGFLRERTTTTLPINFGGVGKDLKDYRIYGNTKQQILPDGYTQVEYVKSDDYSWIDMGLKGNQNTKITTSISFESGGTFLGDITNSSKAISLRFFRNNSGSISRFGNKSVEGVFTNYNYNTKYLIEINSDGILVDNELIHEWGDVGTFETTTNLYLFKNSTSSTAPRAYIYYCKVYDGNTLVRDFIPCYRNSDNEVGLYDLVNNVFYTNQGTGVFTYGSVAPTPEAKIDMVSCGDRTKNLFDKNTTNILDAYYENSGDTIKSSNGNKILYFPCKPNTNYSFTQGISSLSNHIFQISTTNEKPGLGVTVYNFYEVGRSGNYTYTTNSTAKYILLRIRKSDYTDNYLSTIQIEENSIATSYEPYGYKIPINVNNTIINIYLDEPLRKIDGYSDYIDFINGKVVRQLGEVVLDGNTNALTYYGTYGTYNAPLFYMNKSDLIIPSSYNKKIIFASHYRQYLVNSEGAGRMFNYGIRGATASRRIYIRDDRYNNSNDINDWLFENNVTVDYVLETPTEESITLPNIPTIDGNNTLNIETEITPSQVYIKYKSNE